MYQIVAVNIKMFKAFGEILKQNTIGSMKNRTRSAMNENHLNRDKEIDLDENFDNENVFNDNDMEKFGHEHEGQDPDHIENISFAAFD